MVKKISELESGYIIMTEVSQTFGQGFKNSLDYGQDRRLCRSRKNRLKDEEGTLFSTRMQ